MAPSAVVSRARHSRAVALVCAPSNVATDNLLDELSRVNGRQGVAMDDATKATAGGWM